MIWLLNVMLATAPVAAPAATGPAPAAHTLQQDFNDAVSNAASGNCATALPMLTALEHNPKVKPGTLPAAMIALRKGICLINARQPDADETALQAALAIVEKAGPTFDGHIADGWIALGDAAYDRYDFSGATAAYKNALVRQQGVERVAVLSKLAKATVFDGDAQSLSYAEEGLRLLQSVPKPDNDSLAGLHTLHARALLNQGKAQDAYTELKTALSLSDGLTRRTRLSEVALRGDLATSAVLVGRPDDAHLYIAYTGAGRIAKSPFRSAAFMQPPACGAETGLKPDDVAVVEFGIGGDGNVTYAQTVYTRGGTEAAAAFGRAVRDWYWRPEDIAQIPLFYRLLTRVELRCSNVLSSAPGVMGPLRERYMSWAKKQLPQTDVTVDAKGLRTYLRKIATVEGGVSPVERIAALGWLVDTEPASSTKLVAMADDALQLSATTQVPQEVVNWLRIVRLQALKHGYGSHGSDGFGAEVSLSDDPAIAQDALAADTLRMLAGTRSRKANTNEAVALVQKVAQDDRLPVHHPLRQLAWVNLAGKAAGAGKLADAKRYFDLTGLSTQQCALLGDIPTIKSNSLGGDHFPDDAFRLGFEGWVRSEFDITTAGKTENIRPIIAYPPLIFVEASKGLIKNFRYNVTYRPDSALACGANQQSVSFVIPR